MEMAVFEVEEMSDNNYLERNADLKSPNECFILCAGRKNAYDIKNKLMAVKSSKETNIFALSRKARDVLCSRDYVLWLLY